MQEASRYCEGRIRASALTHDRVMSCSRLATVALMRFNANAIAEAQEFGSLLAHRKLGAECSQGVTESQTKDGINLFRRSMPHC